jgi:hypothetical protein
MSDKNQEEVVHRTGKARHEEAAPSTCSAKHTLRWECETAQGPDKRKVMKDIFRTKRERNAVIQVDGGYH